MRSVKQELRLKGSPISSGIAIGRLFLYSRPENKVSEFELRPDEVDGEVAYYRSALSESRREIRQLSERLQKEGAFEGAAILDAHVQMMEEPAFTAQIEAKIKRARTNSASLFDKQVKAWEERFKTVEDPLVRERVKDLQDIASRVLGRLRQAPLPSLADLPPQTVIFASELVPSETAEAVSGRISAFVTLAGGDTSHSAIMAKAGGIPYVGDIPLQELANWVGSVVIVDGRTGDVIINPEPKTVSKYQCLAEQLEQHAKQFEPLRSVEAETIDGYQVRLSANVEMHHEVETLKQFGSHGIGLFRSEFICLSRSSFPTEDEQFQIYYKLSEQSEGQPVVIRTFDVGGDKFTEISRNASEGNPSLGCRAIRFMLKEKAAFQAQLRAILRASAHGEVSILFPMVSGLLELRQAKAQVQEAMDELAQRGVAFDPKIKIGCMIEVPSAAITADLLARECDFFSIGTNDLVQYSLAVDRSNRAMNYLYTPADPGVLRLLSLIVSEANRNQIPVTLCGEMAADPLYVRLLIGLGVGLSVNARYLPIVKQAIRSTSIIQACRLAEKVLALQTPHEVLEALKNGLETQ